MTTETDPQAAAQAESVTQADNQNPDTANQAEGTETPQQTVQTEKQPQGKPWYLNRIHEEAEKRRRAEAELAAFKAQQGGQPDGSTTPTQPPHDLRAAVEAEVRNRELQTKAQAAYKAGKEQFPDYDQAVSSLAALGDGVANPDFLETVFDLENAPAVLHALGSDPNKAAEILQMKPARMGRELEKLAAQLKSAPKQPAAPAKTAPVISPVGNSSSATKRMEDWGPAEWDKHYKEQRRR